MKRSMLVERGRQARATVRRTPWRTVAGLAIVVLVLAGSGCGADDADTDASATLRVGVIPIVDVAPLYLGMEKGFFEEENLTIEPQPSQGGAEIVAGVQSGDLQIGFSNTVSLVLARTQGLPIKIIAPGQQVPVPSVEYSAVLVDGDGPIKTPQDLEGKTIAVNTLKNVGEVTIKAALEKDGVDVSSIRFTELPFPEMEAALTAGQVDAIWAVQQFLLAAEQNGARPVVDNYGAVGKHVEGATYFAMEPYITENPDITARFRRAMTRSLEYARAHPDEVREVVATYTEVPQEMLAELKLAHWSPRLNTSSIQALVDLSAQYGLIEEKPTVDELIYAP